MTKKEIKELVESLPNETLKERFINIIQKYKELQDKLIFEKDSKMFPEYSKGIFDDLDDSIYKNRNGYLDEKKYYRKIQLLFSLFDEKTFKNKKDIINIRKAVFNILYEGFSFIERYGCEQLFTNTFPGKEVDYYINICFKNEWSKKEIIEIKKEIGELLSLDSVEYMGYYEELLDLDANLE